MTSSERKTNEIPCSDGASIPLKSEHFNLTKREFYDGVRLRYERTLKNLPLDCVCQAKFSVEHALSCKIGGFVTLSHNEMRDLTSDMLSSVCKDVCKEPCLELRADFSARGFRQRTQRAFVDVVFCPMAPSNRCKTLASSFNSIIPFNHSNQSFHFILSFHSIILFH